ncbi:MAG: hypothetical protein SVU88_02925 [Candidatus Nanohaloarchaea archaeon]|nr:hypothetical protein [Candidatus Nanohaloarchaea archaeon]
MGAADTYQSNALVRSYSLPVRESDRDAVQLPAGDRPTTDGITERALVSSRSPTLYRGMPVDVETTGEDAAVTYDEGGALDEYFRDERLSPGISAPSRAFAKFLPNEPWAWEALGFDVLDTEEALARELLDGDVRSGDGFR